MYDLQAIVYRGISTTIAHMAIDHTNISADDQTLPPTELANEWVLYHQEVVLDGSEFSVVSPGMSCYLKLENI